MRINELFFALLFISSCKTDIPDVAISTNYPQAVEKIIVGKCATAGCHNSISNSAAGGLDLSSWDVMFNGTSNGAVTIPYRGDYSTLLYFTCTDTLLGLVSKPTMPINLPALSATDYLTLRSWINSGSPDNKGNIAFSGNPLRHKFYVSNQGCDVVSVFDTDRRVIMRMVDVGINPDPTHPEAPHNIRVSADGKFWMAVFLNSDVIQIFDAATDQLIRTIPIGNGISGQWNTGIISSDSKSAYIVDYSQGRISFVDLVTGICHTEGPFLIGSTGQQLHGIALNQSNDTIYVTCQNESSIFKIPINDINNYQYKRLWKFGQAPFTSLKPHDLVFTPDFAHYLVTCQDTNYNEVRVMDSATDTLFAIISVGKYPQEIVVSPSHNLAFVTNMEDNTFPNVKGSVSVIDLNSFTELKKVQVGWQPHGIAVDEKKQLVYVANRNVSGGIAPHHPTACAGKNGYLSVIDLNTLDYIRDYKPELSVDPYSVSVRP